MKMKKHLKAKRQRIMKFLVEALAKNENAWYGASDLNNTEIEQGPPIGTKMPATQLIDSPASISASPIQHLQRPINPLDE